MANTTPSEAAKDTGFGAGDDRVKIDDLGQLKAEGDATQWDDLSGAITGLKLYDTKGKVGMDFDQNSLVFESGGSITTDADCVWFNLQKMHKIKIDSELRMHLHYTKTDTTEREFTLKYRIQPNGGAKVTTWTTITTTTNATNDVFPYTSGSINQIVQFLDYIDWSDSMISSTVQFKLARTDSESGDVEVTFIDGHYEADSFMGSNAEYSKE